MGPRGALSGPLGAGRVALSANSAVHHAEVPSGRRTPSAVRPGRPVPVSVAVVLREFAVRESVAGRGETGTQSEINYH